MEYFSSSLATMNATLFSVKSDGGKGSISSVGGRKAGDVVGGKEGLINDEVSSTEEELFDVEDSVEDVMEDSDDDSDDEEEEEEDNEFEEFMNERKMILQDAKACKTCVDFYAHPERAVAMDGFASGRSFFKPTDDAEEERQAILADALALKKLAVDFAHPEMLLEIDATATARSYFGGAEKETFGAAEERALAIQAATNMAKAVAVYQHPEAPLEVDAAVFGRNYFSDGDVEDVKERELMEQDMASLKTWASYYQHPEAPVGVDSTASARSYFSRASAPQQETDEHSDDREILLEEMKELKEAAVMFRHPEMPLEIDATASARNYFGRASAEEQEADETSDDREILLEEMKELKEAAVMFRHPEMPLEVDATMMSRNYFGRASAEEQQDVDEVGLQEMKSLKALAIDYGHPEMPLQVDASMMSRNYFGRASAEEQQDVDEAVLQEMKALKALAVDYMHPERPVQVDATATARSYLTRTSAPMQEDDEVDEERDAILQDMALMKQQVAAYMHPERSLSVDPSSSGRNYFSRASAVDKESFSEAEERAFFIAQSAALKGQAELYLHPETPIEYDSAAFGRNYFGRPSAEESDDEEERAEVLQEMAQLKKLAVDYMHPECPIINEDACAFGRNYFCRASAQEKEEDECEHILKELAELKRSAVDYMHPERPVVYEDPCAFGRNYFVRASAVDQEEDEYADEREVILAELEELKQGAVDFMHPERPMPAVDARAFGRSYFERADSVDSEDAEERERVLAESAALKKLAVDFAHPEMPVAATDATLFGRNYFSRASAPEAELSEAAQVLADARALKEMAVNFAHPEKAVSMGATAFGRSYFSRASAPEQESTEAAQVLADAQALKKLAVDYLHPEASVTTTDAKACGRNYFTRASARGVAEHIRSEGFENPTERRVDADEHSQHDEYGHFDMDEDIFYDMRQSIVLPLASDASPGAPIIQSGKFSADEEGELSRSPSSVMLFTGALGEDGAHPPLPSMG